MSDNFIRAVNKKVGKNVIARGDEILQCTRIPFKSLSLTVETGGGAPRGRITSIVGDWSSGKTAEALGLVAEFQKRWDDKIFWIDAEGAWDPKWARTNGIQVEKVYVVRPQHAQQAFNIILSAIEESPGCLIVVDSLAALSPKEEVEGSMDDVTVALMARLNSKFLRKLQSSMEEEGSAAPPTLVYINQLRVNVGGYGAPKVEPGGEALQYYPSLKIILRKGDLFDGKKVYKSVTANDEGVEVKAQQIKFYTDKNKTAPFKRRGHYWFYFDTLDSIRRKGTVDRLEEVIRYTQKYEIVKRRGSIYDLVNPNTGELRSFKGSAELANYIRDDVNVQKWVEEEVMKRVVEDMTGVESQEEREETVQEAPVARLRAVDIDEIEGDAGSEGLASG